jgi:hypothetical protein
MLKKTITFFDNLDCTTLYFENYQKLLIVFKGDRYKRHTIIYFTRHDEKWTDDFALQ